MDFAILILTAVATRYLWTLLFPSLHNLWIIRSRAHICGSIINSVYQYSFISYSNLFPRCSESFPTLSVRSPTSDAYRLINPSYCWIRDRTSDGNRSLASTPAIFLCRRKSTATNRRRDRSRLLASWNMKRVRLTDEARVQGGGEEPLGRSCGVERTRNCAPHVVFLHAENPYWGIDESAPACL